MNFQQLEYIIAVDQLKHFGRAADQCFVTQATLSAMIKKLEEELQIIIFDRKRQPVITTEIGLLVIEQAKEIISKRDELVHVTQAEQKTLSGVFNLGIIPTISSSILPIILPQLLQTYPDLELNIEEINTEDIIHRLSTNQLDIGILATPTKNEQLLEEVLYYESMLIYGAADIKKQHVQLGELRDNQVWLLAEGNCFRTQSISLCELEEKHRNHLSLSSNSFDTLINLVDEFGGFTLLPELYAARLSEQKRKKLKQFTKPKPVREISLVYSRPYALKNSIQQLAEFIRNLMLPHLLTSSLPAKEMNIVGI